MPQFPWVLESSSETPSTEMGGTRQRDGNMPNDDNYPRNTQTNDWTGVNPAAASPT